MTAQHPSPAADTRSLQLSVVFCLFTLTGFLLASEKVAHWFVIPVFVCGVIIGVDAFDWFRGRVGMFDPAGIIGLLGVHFFFLAPLLHVVWDVWLPYVVPPGDWREWLGGMASINAIGLLMYRYARERVSKQVSRSTTRAFWQVDRRRLLLAAICGMLLSGALQCWVYARSGGVLGFIEAYSDSIGKAGSEHSLKGWGWILVVASAFEFTDAFSVQDPRRMALRALLAMLTLAAGLYLLLAPLDGTFTLTVMLVLWFVASGVARIAFGIAERGVPGAGMTIVNGMLSAALGILIALELPASADWAIGLLVGVDLLFAGLALIALARALRPLVGD